MISVTAPQATRYLFVDGAHLRIAYDQVLLEFYGEPGSIDLRGLLSAPRGPTSHAARVFLYDCVDDVKRPEEVTADYQARVSAQESWFEQIQALLYYHVKLGQLSGHEKKRRQKKVDVLLAVDMLTFAHRGVIDEAALIAGDLDFVPVVDELVRGGTRVHVYYNPRGAARDLCKAADVSAPMDVEFMLAIRSESFRRSHREPSIVYSSSIPPGLVLRRGVLNGEELVLVENGGVYSVNVHETDGRMLHLSHADPLILEKWVALKHRQVEWASGFGEPRRSSHESFASGGGKACTTSK